MEKFLICQPKGGINDMFCQIGKCIFYAEKYDRTLIIDSTLSDLHTDLSKYFTVNNLYKNIKLDLTNQQIEQFYSDPEFPQDFLLRSNDCLDPVCAPFQSNVPHKFLLHRSFGGGYCSLHALHYFVLNKEISEKIKFKKQQLGNYHAIMIRHRDYNTDYKKALNDVASLNLSIPLFLFTDNHVVQEYAKTLNFKHLITNESLNKFYDFNLPIMYMPRTDPKVSQHEINIQVLMDLFLAALSDHIYPTYLLGYMGDNQFANVKIKSGFINLAIELQNNKQLLENLLG
jgi:hypothetical protein